MGISKSSISRRAIAVGAKSLRELPTKDLSQTPVLVIYVDGLPVGRQHVLCALGVDPQGYKHVSGLAPGVSENPTVV